MPGWSQIKDKKESRGEGRLSRNCVCVWVIFTRLSLFGTVPLLPIVVAIDVEEPDNTIEFDGVSRSCLSVYFVPSDNKRNICKT